MLETPDASAIEAMLTPASRVLTPEVSAILAGLPASNSDVFCRQLTTSKELSGSRVRPTSCGSPVYCQVAGVHSGMKLTEVDVVHRFSSMLYLISMENQGYGCFKEIALDRAE